MELKKMIYRILWVATGLLTACIVVGIIELFLIANGIVVDSLILTYLVAILLLGLFLGLVLGRVAWDFVYVKGGRGEKYVLEHRERMKQFEGNFFANLRDFDIDKAMKWTITIFLIFIMLILVGCITAKIALIAERNIDVLSGLI